MFGTFLNVGTIIVGSLVGLLIHKGLPERIKKIVFQAIGIFTAFLGVQMAFETKEILVMIFSIVIGAILGELLKLESFLERIGNFLKNKFKSKNEKFIEGFVTAFLLFSIGSMTVLGSIEQGLGEEPKLLIAKSILDGFSSIILASTFGFGVLFSVIPLFQTEAGITVFASWIDKYLSPNTISELTAVGGLLLIGLAINILEIKKIKVTNMLPALVIVVIIAEFVNLF